MLENKQQRKIKSPWLAYAGYLFQSFLKRPFGYIVAILFVVYLALILLIVPAALHFEPLFIWNIGGFNMPIFNLYFIAAMAASMAVAIFRTGRDDGTELSLAAKPLTKGTMVGVKTAVYMIIMLFICALTLAIVSLIMPVFGEYNELTNVTGILPSKYISLILSMVIGNIVNMLFFGAIAVFISMVGGQVIIMIGTIGIVFLMCLNNFLFPQIIKSANEVLTDKYNTDILSYSCNTLGQYLDSTLDPSQHSYATIQCFTDDDGIEDYHYDTYEYWTKACQESGRQSTNYVDLGKQLSSIYSSFGLDDSKLKEASKLFIGGNSAYNYQIDQTTHVVDEANLEALNYPICYYGIIDSQGKTYPAVMIVGGDMTISTDNWYARSAIFSYDFYAMTYNSSEGDGMSVDETMIKRYKKLSNKVNELYLTTEQKDASKNLYNAAKDEFIKVEHFDQPDRDHEFTVICHDFISSDQSGAFFPAGEYDNLEPYKKQLVVSQNLLYWAYLANKDQRIDIEKYWEEKGEEVSFPYSSNQILLWHKDRVEDDPKYEKYLRQNEFNLRIFEKGIYIEEISPTPDINSDWTYARLVTSQMGYAETFNNLYQYKVSSFYNLPAIISVWSIISVALFAGSIIVYKKTDFK